MNNQKLVIFSIGPVQSFIAAARKMEDLWSGSYILSHLTSVAINQCFTYAAENDVPFQLVSPYMEQKDLSHKKLDQSLEVASLPNRFTCHIVATNEQVQQLAKQVERKVKESFKALCVEGINKVFNSARVKKEIILQQMDEQIDQMIEFYWTCNELDSSYTTSRKTLESRLAAVKNDVSFGQVTQHGLVCTVCHEREALHDITDIDTLSIGEMRKKTETVWSHRGHEYQSPRINDKEILCAVCLAKRTARQTFKELKAPQTTLFGKYPAIEEISNPYYAVIMFDGDNMGKWFSREHEEKEADMAYHQALSKKLSDYSMNVVPEIIERHRGKLIYSGGDDVLAFLPIEEVLSAASNLRQAFADESIGLGKEATLSGAICIAHVKTPLQYILSELRSLEAKAKKFAYGTQRKDAYTLATYTNGEIRQVTLPWYLPNDDKLSTTYVESLTEALNENLSSTFLYTLGAVFQPLIGAELNRKLSVFENAEMNNALLQIEIYRLLQRAKNNDNVNVTELAETLVNLHEVMPNTLNFMHLLEIARFMKRKKEDAADEYTLNAN